jgi:Tfp pilus assembly protein PilN
MKKINLITSLPSEKQYEIQRWFYMTLFLSLSILLVGAYSIIPQCITYFSLRTEVAALHQKTQHYAKSVQEKDALKKEYDELHEHENKINAYKTQKKNSYAHVAEIVAVCNNGTELESVKFNKKEVELNLLCPTAERAQAMVRQLNATPLFSRMKMISLQQDGKSELVRCTIKGNVIF